MENKLTPTKIMRLMSLAESKTPDQRWRKTKSTIPDISAVSVEYSDVNPSASSTVRNLISVYGPDNKNVESSLGLIDLDGCEDLLGSQLAGTCSIADMSVKSSMFNPKEMTGRSTDGVEEIPADDVAELTARLRAQSGNVAALIEQSFVDDTSFMSVRKIDLTAEEKSCIQNHGTIPVPLSELDMNLTKNFDRKLNDTNGIGVDLSMGSYFKKKTFGLESILPGSGTPQKELSALHNENQMNNTDVITINDTQASDCVFLDATLDQVPVKEPAPIFKAPRVQHIVAQQNMNGDESSMVDTSLSASLIAKWLCKMDLKATPSTLLAEVQRNKDNFATTKQNTKTAKSPVKSKVVRQIDKSALKTIADNQANESLVPLRVSKNSHASSDHSTYVSTLQLCGKTDTASSDGTVDTVINRPAITITNATVNESRSDFNTVGKASKLSNPRISTRCQNDSEDDLICMTSPTVEIDSYMKRLESASGILPSKSPMGSDKSSSDLEYKELDKSINWPDILPNKDYETEQWIQVEIEELEAFVGICTSLEIKLTSLTERWLSVRFELDKINESSVKLETTPVPILLRPGATESCSLPTTVFGQITGPLTLLVIMQDTCSDDEIFIKKNIKISNRLLQLRILSDLKMNNENLIEFPDVQEKRNCCKVIMIETYCEADLQIVLAVSGDHNSFSINGIDVVDCAKIKECLGAENRLVNAEGMQPGKQYRPASSCKRARCILPRNAALHLTLSCSAPPLAVFKQRKNQASLEGTLSIYTVGNVCIKEVKLFARVGIVKLQFKHPSNSDEIHFQMGEKQTIELSNAGTIESTWRVVVRKEINGPEISVFSATPKQVTLGSGQRQSVEITYHGPDDVVNNGFLILENTTDGQNTLWKLVGGQDQPKVFPIKTTRSELAWGRPGSCKSIRLKNTSRHRVKVQCTICGDGFRVDGDMDNKGVMVYSLEPNQVEELSIIFAPNGVGLYYAKLMLILMDKPYLAKVIRLFASGGHSIVRWARSVPRGPSGPALLTLSRGATSCQLLNKGNAPAFVSAQINFNLRFASLKAATVMRPTKAIVAPGALLTLTLETEARALARATRDVRDGVLHIATLSLIVGDDCTRQRINRILEKGADITPSEHLSRIGGKFDGETDQAPMEISLFNESARSLEVLVTELEELTAEITLSRDTLEDQTILVSDDTTIHYHTLCDDHTIIN